MWLYSRDLVNCKSDNTLRKSGVSASSAEGSVMVEVNSGDSGNDESATMSIYVSSSGDEGSLSLISGSSSFCCVIAVTMIGGESLLSNEEDITMYAGSYTVENRLLFSLASSSETI